MLLYCHRKLIEEMVILSFSEGSRKSFTKCNITISRKITVGSSLLTGVLCVTSNLYLFTRGSTQESGANEINKFRMRI